MINELIPVYQYRLSDATWLTCSKDTYDYHNRMQWDTRVLWCCVLDITDETDYNKTHKDYMKDLKEKLCQI